MPSILDTITDVHVGYNLCFKPYYNWNAFNTADNYNNPQYKYVVLNLIITGMPSILRR